MKITHPKNPISQTSLRTRKRRASEVCNARTMLSAESSSLILETELKALSKMEKQQLLLSAGITKEMKPEEGFALKADIGLTWNKLRDLRRYKLHCINY